VKVMEGLIEITVEQELKLFELWDIHERCQVGFG